MSVNFSRELPVYTEIDVLVVGAGPAGICAGISAARNGAKTLIIDGNGCVGGATTVNYVGPFMTTYDAKNEFMIMRGLFEEILEKMKAEGGAIDPEIIEAEMPRSGFYRIGHAHVGPFDHESFKKICSEMIVESGAKLLLYTQFVDVLKNEDAISSVVIHNKNGLSVIKAKVIVDCTGDGDVAARSGVKYDLGRVEDGNMQPATLFFRVNNVDTEKLAAHIHEHRDEIRPFYGPFSWLIKEKPVEWGDVPRAEVCLFEDVEPGEYRLNVTRILNINGTDAEDLTRAELEGLKQAHKIFDFLKKYAAGFENAHFIDSAPSVGIRETRHIDGVYKLCVDDVKAAKVPYDTIAVMATNMDTHNKKDPGGTYYTLQNGRFFGVPYRCLLPNGISNLLVAGRCISADAMAGSAIRMIPCCMLFGQAAGTAAALAVEHNVTPSEVNTNELRATLKKQGAYLGDE